MLGQFVGEEVFNSDQKDSGLIHENIKIFQRVSDVEWEEDDKYHTNVESHHGVHFSFESQDDE